MNCRDSQSLLHAYTDGELDLRSSLDIEQHLQQCVDCRQFHKNIVTLQTGLNSANLYHPAPAHLVGNVRSAVQRESRPPKRRSGFIAGLALSSAAAAVLLATLLLAPRPVSLAESTLEREVVSGYVRSLITHHVRDVESTDKHTVKPWFNGKLDFAPPVIDLRNTGYPLTGGRLDYLEERPVAVLVYARQKHIINLFVWPLKPGSASHANALETLTRQGYHLIHWVQADLQFWAVSDLNAQELSDFARQVQDANKRP